MRWKLAVTGRMPVTEVLDRQWHDTPNAHFCTIRDFELLCGDLGIGIGRRIPVDKQGRRMAIAGPFVNLFAEQGVFVLSRRNDGRSRAPDGKRRRRERRCAGAPPAGSDPR